MWELYLQSSSSNQSPSSLGAPKKERDGPKTNETPSADITSSMEKAKIRKQLLGKTNNTPVIAEP